MRGLAASSKRLIEIAYSILKKNNPITLRQVHYELVAKNLPDYANDKPSIRRLGRQLSKARRKYRSWELAGSIGSPPEYSVPGFWMVDELRKPERVSVWTDAAEYIDCVRESYRRDSWQDQESHCELWGEKASALAAMRPITRKFGITLRVCRGFGSTGMEDQVGRLFEGVKKPIVIFYIGDHDCSGDLIPDDIVRRVEEASGDVSLRMERLAIFGADIKKYNLPFQTIKDTDPRAERFRQKFGKDEKTVELEALSVTVLRRRVEKAISGLIDVDRWNYQLQVQDVELNSIAEFADTIKKIGWKGSR